MIQSSISEIPILSTFNPKIIPYQFKVIQDIRKNFDYSKGVHEIMLSGSIGSAKSILMAHIVVTHCLLNARAQACIGRRSMPDLKDTILQEILDHIQDDLIEGTDFFYNKSQASIHFANGSEIISRSWADKNYRKARSLKLSLLAIEEITENSSDEFLGFYKEYRARVGRRPWIKENIVIGATNPDAPSHSAYEYFINRGNEYKKSKLFKKGEIATRHTYYSVTTDNPFLPEWYIEQLKETFTEKECRRMIYGEWLELAAEIIYYAFSDELNVIEDYHFDYSRPVYISYDFNIGIGKPMSCILFQYIDGIFYCFDECVIHGSRTEDTLEDMQARGLLDRSVEYVIMGDASGKHNDTRTKKTDYSIIDYFFANGGYNHSLNVPICNPPVRTRHIIVNGALKNANNNSKVKIVKKRCPTLIKGLRLSKLKKGSGYIEDDSDEYQHITTALGYAIVKLLKVKKKSKISTW